MSHDLCHKSYSVSDSLVNFSTCSLSENVRREEFQGDEHIVVPVVALRENVLQGHPQGDIFVSEDEIKKSATLWNGTAITVGHPEKRGKPVSANRKEILDEKTVGRLLNIEMNGDKLTGEMFLNIDRLKNVNNGEDVIETLDENEMLEVSTGYFSDFLTDIKPNAKHELPNNADDAHVNIRPDHLALLPNSVGKCSVEDGCGAPRCNGLVVCQLDLSRDPDSLIWNDTSTGDWSQVDKTLEDYVAGYFNETDDEPTDLDFDSLSDAQGTDWSNLPETIRQWIAQHSLLGDANADTFAEGLFFPVVSANNVLFENALDAVNSGRGASAEISDQQLQSARGVARTMLENQFDRDLEDNAVDENEAKSALQKLSEYLFGEDEENSQGEEPEENVMGLSEEQVDSIRDIIDELFERHSEALISDLENEVTNEQGEEVASFVIGATREGIEDKMEKAALRARMSIKNNETNEENNEEANNEQEGGDEGMSENEEEEQGQDEIRVSANELAEDLGFEDADELRSALGYAKNQQEKQEREKERLVGELAENARCQFNEEELDEKGLGELRKLADMAQVETNHALNGSNAKTNEGDEDVDLTPPPVFGSSKEE